MRREEKSFIYYGDVPPFLSFVRAGMFLRLYHKRGRDTVRGSPIWQVAKLGAG